ncbi:divalent-cation tolerance protein CutA [Rubritalea sp.]|uniref:divalent-cation tolerance protein CutA n=1 Tax=Rubritalea sp. TaxID=2109375 RepID=UPI003EF1BD7C
MEVIIVYCTFPTKGDARQIGTQLVEKQLVACVNLLPGVESIYQWEGKVHHEGECLLIMKTSQSRYVQLEKALLELHPYDTPEIICTAVTGGSEGYLNWVRDQTEGYH